MIRTKVAKFLLTLGQIFLFYGHLFSFGQNSNVVPSVFEIEAYSNHTLTIPGMTRYIVTEPKSLLVTQAGTTLTIKGLRIGSFSLLHWSPTMKRVAIKVVKPVPKPSQIKKRLENKLRSRRGVTFNLSYAYSTTKEEKPDETKKIDNHSAGIGLSMPFFKETRLRLTGSYSDTGGEFEFNKGSLSNIRWPKGQNYSMDFGKIPGARSGSATFSRQIEGVRVSPLRHNFRDKKNPVELSVAAGKQRQNEVNITTSNLNLTTLINNASPTSQSLQDRSEDATFVQTFLKYSPRSGTGLKLLGADYNWSFNWTYLDDNGVDSNIFDLGLGLTKGRNALNIALSGDISSLSRKFQYNRRGDRWTMSLNRFERPSESQTLEVSNNTQNNNTQISFNYSPHKFGFFEKNSLTLDANLNERNSEISDDEKTTRYALNLRTTLFKTALGARFQHSDASDSSNPFTRDFFLISLDRRFKWFIPFSIRMSQDNSQVDRVNNPGLSNERITSSFRISIKPIKRLNYNLSISRSEQANARRGTQTSESISHNLSYNLSFFKGKVPLSLSYGWRDQESDGDFQLVSNTTSSQSYGLSTSYRLSNASRVRLQYRHTEEESNTIGLTTRQKFDVNFSTRFHTLFGWKPKTDIRTQAFWDENGNGEYDSDLDRTMPGVTILLNGKDVGQTGDSGELYLGKIKGFQKEVTLDRKFIPRGYIPTTSLDYSFKELKNSQELCLFGFALHTEVSGTVFNDLNENGIFDDRDQAMPGVLVRLSSGNSVYSDRQGRYQFQLIPEGNYKIEVDPLSIAGGFRSIGQIKANVDVERGRIGRQNFGFKASRSLKGSVFLKQKEKLVPVKGVKISFLGQQKVSSKKGRFKLKKILPGDHILRYDFSDLAFKIGKITHQNGVLEEEKITVFDEEVKFGPNPEKKVLRLIIEKL